MAETPMILTALGGAEKAYTSYSAGQANKAIDRFNAAQSRVQAEQAIESGATQQNRVDIKENLLRGAQTSAFASQGVVTGAGTARSVVATGEAVSELDKMMIGINARRQAYGYQVAAANEAFQGRLASQRGLQGAFGSVISAAGEMGYEYEREGGSGTTRQNLLASEGGYGAGDYNGGMNYGPNMAFN